MENDAKRGGAQGGAATGRWSIEVVCRRKKWRPLSVQSVAEQHREELEAHGPITVSEDGSWELTWAQWQRLFLVGKGNVAFETRSRAVDALVRERMRDEKLDRLLQAVEQIDSKVEEVRAEQRLKRRDFPEAVKHAHLNFVRTTRAGKCPVCDAAPCIPASGIFDGSIAEQDHMHGSQLNTIEHTWIICKPCHRKRTDGHDPELYEAAFRVYQQRLRRWLPEQQKLKL